MQGGQNTAEAVRALAEEKTAAPAQGRSGCPGNLRERAGFLPGEAARQEGALRPGTGGEIRRVAGNAVKAAAAVRSGEIAQVSRPNLDLTI